MNKIVERIERELGIPNLASILAQGLASTDLQSLLLEVYRLRSQQLVTGRPAYVMQAGDGSILEIFEWLSAEAIQRAHSGPAVQALWAKFAEACDYIPLASLAECKRLLAEFDPVEV
jgi:hypothetical protein